MLAGSAGETFLAGEIMKSQLAPYSRNSILATALGLGLLVAGSAVGAAPAGEDGETLELSGVATVSDADMESARGREGINIVSITQSSDASQDASLTDNTLSGVTTGDNVVDAGAFRGASGSSTVIQNSGNQVIIQDNTIYNVTLVR